ncbi:MAG: restriction endonuclease subunit S [Planctomycetaceae bacterium]|nr:restriction endonuclease subunit S [Planctomycetaceae bacterium]
MLPQFTKRELYRRHPDKQETQQNQPSSSSRRRILCNSSVNSPVITHRVQELTGGSASPHLNVRDIKAFPTPVPPLPEQQEIVRRVEKLFAFADQIESRLRQAQAHVDRLTQSLLAKAFRGELVPTEHTLATAAGRDYEPASELLARIRAERDNGAPEKPKANRRKRTPNAKSR